MKTIKLTTKEEKRIPTGFRKIYVKNVMGKDVKDKLIITSKKYNKITFEAYRPLQPTSKMFK